MCARSRGIVQSLHTPLSLRSQNGQRFFCRPAQAAAQGSHPGRSLISSRRGGGGCGGWEDTDGRAAGLYMCVCVCVCLRVL